MREFIAFLISSIAGLFTGTTWKNKKENVKRHISSMVRARKAKQKEEEENKEKVMELFEEKDVITNDDIEELFQISYKTAANYLDELQKKGKIIPYGDTERGVFYTKNK